MIHPPGSRVVANTVILNFNRKTKSFTLVERGVMGTITGSIRRGTRSVTFDSGTVIEAVMVASLGVPDVLDRIAIAIADG
jgi:hypothetical protein